MSSASWPLHPLKQGLQAQFQVREEAVDFSEPAPALFLGTVGAGGRPHLVALSLTSQGSTLGPGPP